MAEGKGGRSLLIERGKEMNNERAGQLNLLMIHQAYLNRKVQIGAINRLPELLHVKALINEWLAQECENLKIQSRIEEVETPDLVRIYHHEVHIKKTKRSIILKLQTKDGLLKGHSKVSAFLEGLVGDLLFSHHIPFYERISKPPFLVRSCLYLLSRITRCSESFPTNKR